MRGNAKCPTCSRETGALEKNRWLPFCSERCRLIDLGEWMAGRQRIPADEPVSTDDTRPPLPKH